MPGRFNLVLFLRGICETLYDVYTTDHKCILLIIKSVNVKNFRSIRDKTLHCDNLTVLVGANGSGKSSFLHALDWFQRRSSNELTEDDYYDRQTKNDIKVTVVFKNLSASAKERFSDYVVNGELTVFRIFRWNEGKRESAYYGLLPRNPDFVGIYDTNAREAKPLYNDLRQTETYKDLPTWQNQVEAIANLKAWERNHPEACELVPDNGKFFKLGQDFPDEFVRIRYIKPVHDAADDALEEKSSALAELMDVAVKKSLTERPEIKNFMNRTQKRYSILMDSSGKEEMDLLEERISEIVRKYVPNARVRLSWRSTEMRVEYPKAEASLVEDNYRSTVNRTGHGLQRVFIMSILQHLAEMGSGGDDEGVGESPALVLMIDEPELYQHPNRQRHMSEVLLTLANKNTPGREMQIIYTTHSPHFAGIDRLNQIRLVKKMSDGTDAPMFTNMSRTSLDEVANKLSNIPEHDNETAEALERRLRVIMSPVMNEGFFANAVVLVEGEGDRAALIGVAKSMGHHLEKHGISVIPCGGKSNIDKPAVIFQQLEIPVYAVWDVDQCKRKPDPKPNRILLSVMEQTPVDWPSGVHDKYACLEDNLEKAIKKDMGTKFNTYCMRCMREIDVSKGDVLKKPHAIAYIINAAMRDGISCNVLEKIVQTIVDSYSDGKPHGT